MKGITVMVIAAGLFVSGCKDKSPTEPTPVAPTFVMTLLPANENPPISNAESVARGTVTITLNVVRDGANNITSATANFQVGLTSFPAGANITAAHIHEGVPSCNCPVRVNLALTSGEVTLTNGAGSITKNNINVTAADAQGILNNPQGYYFNVHTTLNPGGVVRAQLVRTQ